MVHKTTPPPLQSPPRKALAMAPSADYRTRRYLSSGLVVDDVPSFAFAFEYDPLWRPTSVRICAR
jgi:hypothetical protein